MLFRAHSAVDVQDVLSVNLFAEQQKKETKNQKRKMTNNNLTFLKLLIHMFLISYL